jgi:serine/threonine protein kinase
MGCAFILDAPRTGDGVTTEALEPQHALALRPGVLLADRFRLVRSVRGTSSFAFSYHAEDLTTGESVAVKEFFPRSLVSRGADGMVVRPHSPECERDFLRALHRFALEGGVLAESTQANLVRVRAVVDANGTSYLVMAQHDTQPLAEYVRSAGGRISSTEAGRLVQQLLSALQVLHTESIIHRDLSPRSVHVGAGGSAILLEFSARRHLPVHATDLASGFAAFEQYGMRDIGPWTDVYAMSALLYYMLTGSVPPSALDRAAGEPLVSPHTFAPNVAPAVARLVVKGMALLPQQRPHAVSELRRLLDSALAEAASASAPRNASTALAPDASGSESASPTDEHTRDEYDRSMPLRLAAGGIVLPGEERGIRLLRMLGSAATRLRRSMMPGPAARIDSRELASDDSRSARAVARAAESAPQAEGTGRRAPFVPVPAAPMTIVPEIVAAPMPTAEDPPRHLDLAAELAMASDAMQSTLERENTRRRFGIAAVAGLVVVVGASLVLLARNGRANSIGAQESSAAPNAAGVPAATTAPAAAHVSVDAGAVLQSATRSAAAAAHTEADSPAKHALTTPTRGPVVASAAPEREPLVTAPRQPNVKIAVTGGAPDLKIVPQELLVDARTRLTNGQDQVEQGEYVVARKMYRSAVTQLDSIVARYPESQAVKNLKRDLEQADALAVQACTAENEMRKRRGEQVRACQ